MSYEQNELDNEMPKESSTTEKMIRGSAWMSAGSIISRLLGAAYIIPWYALMGENAKLANNLASKGYNIYALFLMISTAGIPSAIAKQISYYNSLNEYKLSKRLFKHSMVLMAGFGIVSAFVMFFAAPLLAEGNKDLIPTMRALSLAVLIFPCMSVIRGFFQGYQDLMPFAVSQIIEQIVRVFYMLLTALVIMKLTTGDYVQAVTQSTLAAFVGMLVALLALIWYYNRQKGIFRHLEATSNNEIQISTNNLLKEMIVEAVPFIVVGSGITLFKLVDQYTFERFMGVITQFTPKQTGSLFTIFSANPDKLTMIVISLATAMAVTSLPLITESFTKNDTKNLANLVSNSIQLFFFVMIPATLGMIALAFPMNTIFYGPDKLGSSVLVEACFAGIVCGFFMLVSTILQGLYKNKEAVRYLLYGLGAKFVAQLPCIWLFQVYGPLLATIIGFCVTCYFTTRDIAAITRFKVSLTARRTFLITILSLLMLIGTLITKGFLYLFLNPESRLQALLIVLIAAAVGVGIYGYLALKVRLADRLLGERAMKIRVKLKMK